MLNMCQSVLVNVMSYGLAPTYGNQLTSVQGSSWISFHPGVWLSARHRANWLALRMFLAISRTKVFVIEKFSWNILPACENNNIAVLLKTFNEIPILARCKKLKPDLQYFSINLWSQVPDLVRLRYFSYLKHFCYYSCRWWKLESCWMGKSCRGTYLGKGKMFVGLPGYM